MMKRRIGKYAVRLLLAALVTILLTGEALASYSATINVSSTPVYTKSGSKYKKIGTLKKGAKVTITAFNTTWAKVNYGKYTVLAPLKTLRLTNRLVGYTTKAVSCYKTASTSGKKLGTVAKGTKVYVSGRNGSFFMCENAKGSVTGYIQAGYLSGKAPSTGGSSANASQMPKGLESVVSKYYSGMSDLERIEHVIYVAQNQLGKKYSSNPSAPTTFDCSGLVRYCYQQVKITLPASAYDQGYSERYAKIGRDDLKRGDVVCFNTNTGDSDLSDHTGIYVGEGWFIHASSEGKGVTLSNLNSGYYYDAFSWGRRIIK